MKRKNRVAIDHRRGQNLPKVEAVTHNTPHKQTSDEASPLSPDEWKTPKAFGSSVAKAKARGAGPCSLMKHQTPDRRGMFDDSDFSSGVMCCECGGGLKAPAPTSFPTVSVRPTPAPRPFVEIQKTEPRTHTVMAAMRMLIPRPGAAEIMTILTSPRTTCAAHATVVSGNLHRRRCRRPRRRPQPQPTSTFQPSPAPSPEICLQTCYGDTCEYWVRGGAYTRHFDHFG